MVFSEPAVLDIVARTIFRYNMLWPRARAGVAVSGGADSVCLLHVLAELAIVDGWSLELLHLNHGLRGEESEGDAEFVARLAERLGLPIHAGRVDLSGRKGNLEEAAREARIEFFASVARTAGLDRVATGHTLDDQAETVMFRALRGTGGAGLAGILPVTGLGLIRPLLNVERAQVLEWLRSKGEAWREDSSNRDASFARNRIRGELLPAAERIVNPGARRALARLAEVARAEDQYWDDLVQAEANRLFQRGSGIVIDSRKLLALNPAVARRLVRSGLAEAAGHLRGIEFEHVEAVLKLAARERGEGNLQLPGIQVQRSFEWVRFAKDGVWSPAPTIVTGPGTWRLVGVGDLTVATMPAAEATLRGWAPGDRFVPAGRGAAIPVRDLFQKQRVPRWARRSWPVLEQGRELIWVRGFGLSDRGVREGWNIRSANSVDEGMPI